MENKRTCGGCTACCLTHEIYEIKKPAGKLCPHCKPNVACKIYRRRPKGCVDFYCEWRKGVGDESHRPDRLGAVLDFCTQGPPGKILLFKKILQIWEARAGALDTPVIWEATWVALDSRIVVYHIYLSGKKVSFLPEGVDLPEEVRRLIVKEGFEIMPYPILRPQGGEGNLNV